MNVMDRARWKKGAYITDTNHIVNFQPCTECSGGTFPTGGVFTIRRDWILAKGQGFRVQNIDYINEYSLLPRCMILYLQCLK